MKAVKLSFISVVTVLSFMLCAVPAFAEWYPFLNKPDQPIANAASESEGVSDDGTISGYAYTFFNPRGRVWGITVTFKPHIYVYGTHDYVVTTEDAGAYEVNNVIRYVETEKGEIIWIRYRAYVSEEEKGFQDYVSEELVFSPSVYSIEHLILLVLIDPIGWNGFGTISGSVYDTETDEPLAGVTITFKPHTYGYGTHDYVVTTDTDGHYEISDVIRFTQTSGGTVTWIRYKAYVSEEGYEEYVSDWLPFYPAIHDIEHDIILSSHIIHVDDDAPAGGDGSQEHPFNTIQDAIALAEELGVPGITISVAEGVYYGEPWPNYPSIIFLIEDISLVGAGMDETLISGVVQMANNTTLSGFELDGILCPTLSNAVIRRNHIKHFIPRWEIWWIKCAIERWAVEMVSENVLIENNIMTVYSTGDNPVYHPRKAYGIFTRITNSPGDDQYANWVAKNNTLRLQADGYLWPGYPDGTPGYIEPGFGSGFEADGAVRNNAIVKIYSGSVVPADFDNSIGHIDTSYNFRNGTGEIVTEDQFIDLGGPGDYDLHLVFGSELVDAGDPADDYSREPMPNGGRINMGAYGNTEEATRSRPRYKHLIPIEPILP